MTRIVLFPNSEVEVEGNVAWSTEAFQEFITRLGEKQTVTLAATSVPHLPGSRHCTELRGSRLFQLRTLGEDRYQLTRFSQLTGYTAAFFRMLFLIPKQPIWYIFLPGHMGTLACLVCCLWRKRFGIYVRGEWPTTGLTGMLYRWYFRRATFVFATGASFTKTLSTYNDHVQEVSPMMRFQASDLREKTSYQINGRARILYVGAIDPAKGALEIIQAMPSLTEQHDVELKILGSGSPELTQKMQSAILASGCADRIEMVGHVSDQGKLAQWFASADLFAFPTYYKEGFPRVVYEAMGFGLPVICTDIEGGKVFLRDHENCRLVPKQDTKALAEALAELLNDPSLRTTIGQRAFQDARDLFVRFEGISHGGQVAEAVDGL